MTASLWKILIWNFRTLRNQEELSLHNLLYHIKTRISLLSRHLKYQSWNSKWKTLVLQQSLRSLNRWWIINFNLLPWPQVMFSRIHFFLPKTIINLFLECQPKLRATFLRSTSKEPWRDQCCRLFKASLPITSWVLIMTIWCQIHRV